MKSLSILPMVTMMAAGTGATSPVGWLDSAMRSMGGGNANTSRGFNRLSQKGKRRRTRQRRSQSFKGGAA